MNELIRDLTLIFGSSLLAFVITIILVPSFTKFVKKHQFGQQIKANAITGEKATLFAALHAKKAGTPTMGGVLIWGSSFLVVLLSRVLSAMGLFDRSLLNRKETWIPIFTLLAVGTLGALDDYLNIKGIGKQKGLSAKFKLLWLSIFGGVGAWWFFAKLGFDSINVPGIGDVTLGWWYIPLFIFIILATSNSVNLTDGLDGLASGLLILAFGVFGVIAYAKGLLILSAFCAVITGSTVAFLWFNIPPARFYMGDTGALSLGATLGVIAMLTDQVLILPLIGFIFVIETISVIIQITSKKLFKRKVFKIAPIHHHFEAKGWPEYKVVMRFWTIGAFTATIGLILGLISITT
ncbi:phospho-N-acetylmuramoyl-pentapeptide-transferase [Candidatus Peregrinibacteria bacterium]|jgi:phospho-N-acetylmuramoyl-pentapeptide-transferase|nr:phospho-N-acetylmuramoyl-pentapeptide-transferase [Candidatus Peregrinibacteria bacterium]MBT4055868.1 phospho-N-acetylmuramoyl-pentapeptide-transferase [Candidatus Peregrinibacteria bacterium]